MSQYSCPYCAAPVLRTEGSCRHCNHQGNPDDKTILAPLLQPTMVGGQSSLTLAACDGRCFSVRDSEVVGRSQIGQEVLEPHVEVSRRHAQFFFRENGWFVVDLNSSNGTFLDGQKIPPKQPTRFTDGQQIGLSRILGFTVKIIQPTATTPDITEPDHPNRRNLIMLFADIKGSVDFFQEQGTVVAKNWIAKLFRMLTEIITEHGGSHLKDIGDALLAIFDEPQAAVLAAVKMQSIIREHNRGADPSEHYFLRIGMNMGSVLFENNDVFGNAVNIASRVQNLAPPERIYITETLCRKLEKSHQFQLRRVGAKALKGVKTTTEIYEIVPDGYSEPPSSPS